MTKSEEQSTQDKNKDEKANLVMTISSMAITSNELQQILKR